MQQKIVYCIVSYNILYKINNFPMAKAKAMLLLIQPISKKKSLYTNFLNKKDPTSINKKIPD